MLYEPFQFLEGRCSVTTLSTVSAEDKDGLCSSSILMSNSKPVASGDSATDSASNPRPGSAPPFSNGNYPLTVEVREFYRNSSNLLSTWMPI